MRSEESAGKAPSGADKPTKAVDYTVERLEREIAERQRVITELEDCERRFRTLVGEIKDYAIFAMDTDGRALTWNEGVESVLGYGKDEFIGSPIEWPFLPEDIAAGVPQLELETARRAGSASDDRWLRKKDGTRFYASGRTTAQLDDGGRVIGFTKVFRDDTQRVLSEAARLAEARRFRTLVQNLRDYAIYMLDAAGLITEWTEGAELVTGYEPEEVVGKHFEMLYTPGDRASQLAQRELEQAAQQGRSEREGWRVTRNGERIWVNEITTAVYDSAGLVAGYTKISRNLTLRKRTEDALREADRRKDEFLATLAHELRNPLSPLRHGLAIIRLAGQPSPSLQPTLEMMERQLTHLVRLVDDLLDVARISTGKVTLHRAVIPLDQVLATSIEATHTVVESRAHHLLTELGPDELAIDGDFDRLAQVFSNLISNSAKYMEPGGTISVRALREDGHAVVTVKDTGIGIPPSELSRIFETFSQVQGHHQHAQGGLGLGLSLVKGLIDMHGGTVRAHSAGPGQGSEFIVRLPLARTAQDVAPAAAFEEPQSTHPLRILVVDDNRDAAETIATLLKLRQHQVFVAYDGHAAIDQVQRFAPEIVLLDLGMPDLDGLDTARRLRTVAGGARLKIIALTGWGQVEDRARTRAAGFDFHLVKPVDIAELERVLQQLHAETGTARREPTDPQP